MGVIAKILIEPATVDLSAAIPIKTLTATAKDAQDNAISNLPEGTLKWTQATAILPQPPTRSFQTNAQ